MTRGRAPRDRRPAEGWTARPPGGWEPVAAVCRAVFGDLPSVAERINAAITREVADFQGPASVFSPDDLRWSTSRNVAGFLHGVAEHRAPSEEELSFRRLIGQRSAIRGSALQPLLTAFHIGYRELWSILVEQASRTGGRAPALLLAGGSTIWQWMLATTNAVTESYQQELARREAFEARATAHFIEAIAQDPSSDECAALAKELGFGPAGRFRVLALAGPIGSGDVARTMVSALLASQATATHAQRGRTALVIVQGIGAPALEAALAMCPGDAPVGVGLEGEGLEGARSSMIEAEWALDLAMLRRRACHFDEDWFPAIMLSHRSSVERMLAPGVSVAASKPHLADAVRVFANAEFSVAESARQIGISQNSLRYRLTRWHELTGWSPWSYDGLTRSVMALELAAGHPRAQVPTPDGPFPVSLPRAQTGSRSSGG